MNTTEFFQLLNDNLSLYFYVLIGTVSFYYILFKKDVFIIVDPFFITLLYSSFATSVVVFLFFCSEVSLLLFISFLLSQIALCIGYKCYKPLRSRDFMNEKINVRYPSNFIIYAFFLSSILYMFLKIYTYIRIGIPLFMLSRLTLFSEGGGIGFIGRIVSVYGTISLFFLFYLYNCKNKPFRLYLKLYFLFYLCTLLLSGSKGAILEVFVTYYLYLLCYGTKKELYSIKKYQYVISAIIFLFAVVVILLQSESSTGALLTFVFRLVASGDVFYMAYPNNVVFSLGDSNSLNLLFGEFLGTFRLCSWNDIPRPLGMQLYEYCNGYDASIGPNSRHNVIGLVVFGCYGGIVFSFLIGWLVSYVRSRLLYSKICKRSMFLIAFVTLYASIISSETDVTLLVAQSVNLIISLLLGLCIFLVFVPIIVLFKRKI